MVSSYCVYFANIAYYLVIFAGVYYTVARLAITLLNHLSELHVLMPGYAAIHPTPTENKGIHNKPLIDRI